MDEQLRKMLSDLLGIGSAIGQNFLPIRTKDKRVLFKREGAEVPEVVLSQADEIHVIKIIDVEALAELLNGEDFSASVAEAIVGSDQPSIDGEDVHTEIDVSLNPSNTCYPHLLLEVNTDKDIEEVKGALDKVLEELNTDVSVAFRINNEESFKTYTKFDDEINIDELINEISLGE
jgi:hypothetical protein